MTKSRQILILCVCGIALAGCIEYNEHVSSEEETIVDTRLIGDWKDASRNAGPDDRYTISPGSISDETRSLLVFVEGDVTGPATLRTTRIGDHDFLSGQLPPDTFTKKTVWEIYRYKFVSKDEVKIFELNEEKVADAIRAGDLKGTFKTHRPGLVLWLLGVETTRAADRITSTREELRQYLAEHPDDCFDLKTPLYHLKRVKKGPGA